MFDRKEIDPEPKAYVYHGSAGRARNRHVKTGPPSTTPHFFTYYPHTPSFFPHSELRIYAPNCQTQSWRLASTQQDNPASFLKALTCRHRTKSSVSLRMYPAHRLSCSRPPSASQIGTAGSGCAAIDVNTKPAPETQPGKTPCDALPSDCARRFRHRIKLARPAAAIAEMA